MPYDNDDNIFKALQQFIENFGDEFESLDQAIDEFMSYYRNEVDDDEFDFDVSPEIESMEMFEEAMRTDDDEQRIEILKEAIELWPHNWDAHVELISGSITEQINQFRELEVQAKKVWEKTERIGWFNSEERPYIRLKYMLAMVLFKNGLLEESRRHLEEIYAFDEHDSLGSRYTLMAIYCRLYDWSSAFALYNNVPYSASDDDRMIIPLLILALLVNKTTMASDLMIDLKASNSELGQLFQTDHWPVDEVLNYVEAELYTPGTFSSLALALGDLLPIIIGSDYLYTWLYESYHSISSTERVNVSDKVISFEAASQRASHEKADRVIDIWAGIGGQARRALFQAGVKTPADFASMTEQEALNIKYIGPKTIQQLKQNGIVFKEN